MDTLMTDVDVDSLATSLNSVAVRLPRPPTWRLQFDTVHTAQDAQSRLMRMWDRDGIVCTTSVDPVIHKRLRKTVWIVTFTLDVSARDAYHQQCDLSKCRHFLRVTYGGAVLGKI